MVHVLDASLILASLNRERGGDRLADFLDDGIISVATYVEVVTKLIDEGASFEVAEKTLADFDLPVIELTIPLARRAAQLREATREKGLSLGDRICLATAESVGGVAVTADRAWAGLDIGIPIQLIR